MKQEHFLLSLHRQFRGHIGLVCVFRLRWYLRACYLFDAGALRECHGIDSIACPVCAIEKVAVSLRLNPTPFLFRQEVGWGRTVDTALCKGGCIGSGILNRAFIDALLLTHESFATFLEKSQAK